MSLFWLIVFASLAYAANVAIVVYGIAYLDRQDEKERGE